VFAGHFFPLVAYFLFVFLLPGQPVVEWGGVSLGLFPYRPEAISGGAPDRPVPPISSSQNTTFLGHLFSSLYVDLKMRVPPRILSPKKTIRSPRPPVPPPPIHGSFQPIQRFFLLPRNTPPSTDLLAKAPRPGTLVKPKRDPSRGLLRRRK